MTITPETELVRSAKAGDVTAFEALYRAYNDRIYNFARRVTGSADDAGDVAQETFIRAWNSLRQLRDDATFGVWLHRIALNRSRDAIKRRAKCPSLSLDCPPTDEGGTVQIESEDAGPEEALISTEAQNAVRQAVDSLNDEHRLVVTLHHIEGMDVESVASILGVPRGTVMSRLSRARETLRRKLSPYVQGDHNVLGTK
jgi:RNA polymerase sigma-70 factor, ECF subfamily